MLKPAHVFAFAEACIAGNDVGPAVAEIEQDIEEAQPNAGHKDRRDRHQSDAVAGGVKPCSNHGAFVLAEEFLDPLERNGINVPGVPGDVGHLFHAAVVGSVEMMVHAGREPQGNVAAIAVEIYEIRIAKQILQTVWKSLDLHQLSAIDRAARADDSVAWADKHRRIH